MFLCLSAYANLCGLAWTTIGLTWHTPVPQVDYLGTGAAYQTPSDGKNVQETYQNAGPNSKPGKTQQMHELLFQRKIGPKKP